MGEVKVSLVDVIKTHLREGEPFILKGPVEAFQARIVLGVTDAGKEVLEVELTTGTLELTREFATVVRMDIGQVAFGQEEQAFEEVSRLAGRAPRVDTGEGQPGAMFEGGKEVAALPVPADFDGIDVPQTFRDVSN
jgi:hypothetical protein